LKKICEKGLKVSDANCIELLVLADRHGAMALKRAAIAHIKENAKFLISSPQWENRIGSLSLIHKEIVETALI
jgi:hypothetical protein